MTKGTISETAALKALLSETADHQILAEMLGFVADRLMALDVDHLCGAQAHERSNERQKDVIRFAVFFSIRYAASYRDLEEIMADRGVDVDYVTLSRGAREIRANGCRRGPAAQILNQQILAHG